MNTTQISPSPSHESVARRAREIWLRLGSPDGQDLAIWLQAERELRGATLDSQFSIDREQLEAILEAFDYLNRSRGPTALDLT